MKKKWTVYIIECSDGRLYTGITVDMERRFKEHRESAKGAKFFNSTNAERIVYQEIKKDRSQASIREAQIKKLSRKEKDALIQRGAPIRSLLDLEGVGKAMQEDFHLLGIKSVDQLKGKKAIKLYERLEKLTGKKHDPCVLDVFNCAIAQAEDENLSSEKKNGGIGLPLEKRQNKNE